MPLGVLEVLIPRVGGERIIRGLFQDIKIIDVILISSYFDNNKKNTVLETLTTTRN
jgi:hypothetical protein